MFCKKYKDFYKIDIMYLFTIYVAEPELFELYNSFAEKHNQKLKDDIYFDAGLDVFSPLELKTDGNKTSKMNTQIVATLENEQKQPMCFYMYPRSSISKTPLRLANSVGIIDSGYRGNMIGVFDNISSKPYTIEKHSRLLQLCAPDLGKFEVSVVKVDDFESLKNSTSRGAGGFGSTGK